MQGKKAKTFRYVNVELSRRFTQRIFRLSRRFNKLMRVKWSQRRINAILITKTFFDYSEPLKFEIDVQCCSLLCPQERVVLISISVKHRAKKNKGFEISMIFQRAHHCHPRLGLQCFRNGKVKSPRKLSIRNFTPQSQRARKIHIY